MADTRRGRTIAAGQQEIWDLLADFAAISSWAANVDHSCLLSSAADGVAVGTARRVQIGRDTVVERIAEFDPPRALAYHVEGMPRLLGRLRNRWTLTPGADGSTVVTLTNTVDIGPHPLQRLAERAVGRIAAKQSDVMLAGLANRLAGSHV